MVNGPSPGPAPAAHALFSSSPATLSKLRASAQEKLRRNVPTVEGAGTQVPSSSAARRNATRWRRRSSHPHQSRCHQGHSLWPTLARPGTSPRCTLASTSCFSPSRSASVIGSTRPLVATAFRSSKTTSRASSLCDNCRIWKVPPGPGPIGCLATPILPGRGHFFVDGRASVDCVRSVYRG